MNEEAIKKSDSSPVCRICGAGVGFQSVRAKHVFGGRAEHAFYHCEKCDAVYLFPVPTEEEESRFYRQEFEKFMATRAGHERDWTNAERHVQTNQDHVRRRWKFMDAHVQPRMQLLEIGCSTGFMMDFFRDSGVETVGIELSEEFIPFLVKKGHQVYKSLDALEEGMPGSKFDIITHFFVFEHIRDPYAFLKRSYDLLKSGGKIIAEIPCVNDPLTSLYSIDAFERFYWSIAHHYYYSPRSIEYVLKKLGMTFSLEPEQRYDLSNHLTWMIDGKPGGQGKFGHVLSEETIEKYQSDLRRSWYCDTMFLYITKP